MKISIFDILTAGVLLSALPLADARAQLLSAEKSVAECGQVVFNRPETVDFELTNSGSRPVTITNVRTSCGCTSVSYPKGAIAPGSKFTLGVTYDARTMGHFQKSVGVWTTDSYEPLMLTVKGVVISPDDQSTAEYKYRVGEFLTDMDNLEFDNVNHGDVPLVRMHVYNDTDEPLQPAVLHLPAYLSADVYPQTVAPRHSADIVIQLDSRNVRDYGLTQTSIYLGASPGDKVGDDKEIPVSIVMLPDFGTLSASEMANAPKLSLSSESINLGSFGNKRKLKGTVLIENEGKSNLEIRRLQMFTAGLEVSLGKTVLKPGEKTKLKVAAVAGEIGKARSKPRVLMVTNDPQHSNVTIYINTEK